jgi:CAAX protease family protein
MNLSKAILFTVLYFIVIQIEGFWILIIPEKPEYLNFLNASLLINSIITLIILTLLFRIFKRADLLIFDKTKSKFYLLAVALGIAFVFFQPFLNIMYYQEFQTDLFNIDFNIQTLSSPSVLASILFVPITEELFFRNYIQRGLAVKFNVAKSIIITSILFSFIHIPFVSLYFDFMAFSLHQAYIVFFGGLISGILFYKSKSITPSILFHAFWNLTLYVI